MNCRFHRVRKGKSGLLSASSKIDRASAESREESLSTSLEVSRTQFLPFERRSGFMPRIITLESRSTQSGTAPTRLINSKRCPDLSIPHANSSKTFIAALCPGIPLTAPPLLADEPQTRIPGYFVSTPHWPTSSSESAKGQVRSP